MTVLVTTLRYSRTPHLLWRDTGQHVLVLAPQAAGEVAVLGGGGAAVWRLLAEPRTLADIQDHFTDATASAPDLATLLGCLDQLAASGVVQASEDQP